MGRLIDADIIVNYQTYDDEYEEFPDHKSTIAEFLDAMTDEGCPEAVDAVPVRHGWWKCSDDMYETAVCSVCGYDTEEPFELIQEHITDFQFCSHCGADMRKDGEAHESVES